MSSEDEQFSSAMRALAAGDMRNARRLLRQAADAEHMSALIIYAGYLEYGVGGHPNAHKALNYYRRAAELGDPTSCIIVAKWHSDRKQIPQAKFWLRKSYHSRAQLAEIRLSLDSRSCKTTYKVKAQLWHIHHKPDTITCNEQAEVAALIEDYVERRPEVKNAQAGRDKIREAKRRERASRA